jgi:simple sugar transport system permease protein
MAAHLDTGPAPSGAEPAAAGLAAASGEVPAARPHFLRRFLLRPEAGGAISALVVFIFFAVLAGQNGFLTVLGTADWLDTASELGIIAVPIGMLMIAGEFDLSIGSVVGASSMIVAICAGYYSLSPWVGVGLAFAAAAGIGFVNGLIVVWTKLPSFIVTLATMLMITGGMLGISIALTGSTSISAIATGSAAVLFTSKWQELHVSILYWLVLTAIATWVMQRTPFGNWVYATGGNGTTARLAGVPLERVKVILFMCSSLGAALAGTIETLTFQNGNITLGSAYVFTGIAASVIGGILLTGGYGSPVGSVFGSLTYGIVSMGVFFLGWNADLTELFIGLLLLLAVLANHRLRLIAMGRE